MDGQVGELYVSLGIKGSEQTIGALTSIKGGMGDVKSMSLETKAAILGAVYGLEQLMSHSLSLGTSITNTSKVIGIGSETLYRWGKAIDFAAGKSGVGITAFNKMFDLSVEALKGHIPDGLKLVNTILAQNNIPLITPAQIANDIPGTMQKLQQLAQLKDISLQQRAAALGGLIGDKDVIAALMKGALTPESLARVPTPGAGQFEAADRANQRFLRMGAVIDNALIGFTSRHANEFASDVEKIVPELIRLLEAIDKLAGEVHAFQLLDTAISSLAKTMGDAGKVISDISNITSGKNLPASKEDLKEKAEDAAKFGLKHLVAPVPTFIWEHGGKDLIDNLFKKTTPEWKSHPNWIGPAFPDITPPVRGGHASNTTINAPFQQTNNGVDFSDEKQTANLERQYKIYQSTSAANIRIS